MMAKLERSPQQARMEAVSRDALVQAALQEITQNYREASLSNVARAYGVSLAYVSECVRAQTGRTYKELLQKHRMETAARLLRRSDLNIQQIIAQVGYENTSYFYRLFHERYGLSPREYRLVRTGTAPRRPLFCFPRPSCCCPAHGGLFLPRDGENSGTLWNIVLY
jgi:YesN/AraC family two-component response regulator